MATLLLFLLSVAVSASALSLLTKTNRKRRRVYFAYRGPGKPKAWTATLWLVVITPGLLLLLVAQYTAFLSWLGALGTIGWLIAVQVPRGAEATSLD